MQHQGDYNSGTAPYYNFPPNPNPPPPPNTTTDFHHQPPFASAPPFTASYHPQPPPPPSSDYYPPYHPTSDPLPPTSPPSFPSSNPNNNNNNFPQFDPPFQPQSQTPPYLNNNNNNNINNNNLSYDHHQTSPPLNYPPQNPVSLNHASTFQYPSYNTPNPVPVYDTPYDSTTYGRSVSDISGDYYGKKHDLGMSNFGGGGGGFGDGVYAYQGGKVEPYGSRGTSSKSSTWKEQVVFDDFGRPIGLPGKDSGISSAPKIVKAVPKVDTRDDVKGGGVQKFRVKLLAESGGQSTMDVLCQIGLDGIRMLDPSTSRTLRIYPLDTITKCEVYDSSTFAFWSKSTVDIEPRRIRLQSNSYTTNTLLDTVTAATIQVKEMGGRSRPVDTVKVTEQSTEKKKGLGDWMNKIKPQNEEKDHWVPDEAVTKCTGCSGDFSAFNRKHHCRNCGDIFCDKCTHGRIALTSEDNAPQVRVCDRCMVPQDHRRHCGQCGDMFCNNCIRERISLTSEDNAPQVRGNIKCRCDNARRRNHNELSYAQGQSKSAAKRRAQKLGRCFKCGKFSHDKACPENHDNDFRKLFFLGPIRCYTEKLLNPRGYAHARMILELDRLSEHTKRKFSS